MRASYKFLKHKGGVSSFAFVGIEATPAPTFLVKWPAETAKFEQLYGPAVIEGITEIARWHAGATVSTGHFTVAEFTELTVDTMPDAVRCAAGVAAWKALGHSEADIDFEFDGEWRLKRRPAVV